MSSTIAEEVKACGHRIVHGGTLGSSCLLDADTKAEVQRASMFAPLHNPTQLHGVAECLKVFPHAPQVCHVDHRNGSHGHGTCMHAK